MSPTLPLPTLTPAAKTATIPPLPRTDSRPLHALVNLRAEMDFRHCALILLIGLTATSGCRQNAAQRELLERELRMQEDRIYELEAKLEDSQRQLNHLSGRIPGGEFCPPSSTSTFGDRVIIEQTPSSVLPRSSSGDAPANPAAGKPGEVPHDTAPPKVELPMSSSSSYAPPPANWPIISPPDPNKPEGVPSRGGRLPAMLAEMLPKEATGIPQPEPTIKEMSSPKFRSPSEMPRSEPPHAGSSRREPGQADVEIGADQLPSDMTVASIALHRGTGGWNADGAPGDDGIFVLVEPRNTRGQIVPTIGELSIVLIDPAIIGEGGRYARWDFTPQDAAALYRPAVAGGSAGLHMELAWPAAPPAHSRLKLFVRFSTEDGRRFQADKELKVDLGPSAAAEDVILQPVPLTSTGPETSSPGERTAAAVGVDAGRAVPAGGSTPPLRWSGPRVSTQTDVGATLETPSMPAVPTPVVPPLGSAEEGPQGPRLLGPTLAPPQNEGVWRR